MLDNTRQFHTSSCDWRVSDIRKFLNDEYTNLNGRRMSFYQNIAVFTPIERSVIATTNVTILDMAGTVEPGTNTHFTSQDHVFLLSVDEMAGNINKASGTQTAATAYGFNEERMFNQQQKYTRAYVTDFANSEGVHRLRDAAQAAFRDDGGGFWLRTPGISTSSAKATASAAVGHLTIEGFPLNTNNIGVRPALLTNKAPVIFLQDVATLPWNLLPAALGSDPGYQNHRLWQEVANFINPLVINYLFGYSLQDTAANNAVRMYETVIQGASSGLASFIGANSKRIEQTDPSGAYYDGGIYRHFKFILKTSELGEVTYTINAITLEGVQLEAATTQAENAYFDVAAITNVASDTPRSGDYTYSYPFTSYVIRLAKVANQGNYNLSTEFKHGADEEQFAVDRLIFFQHQATALDEKLNALHLSSDTIKKMNEAVKTEFDKYAATTKSRITKAAQEATERVHKFESINWHQNDQDVLDEYTLYQTEYGSGVLEIDLTTTPPTILTADAGLVINEGATVALSPEITTFNHDLTLNGGALHLQGPVEFKDAKVVLNQGELNIASLQPDDRVILPAGSTFGGNVNIVPPDGYNWQDFIILKEPAGESAALHNHLASAIVANSAMDLVANSIQDQLNYALSGMMALGVSQTKVTTGSHVKAYGGNLALGVSRGFKRALIGVFAEGGFSHFNTYDVVKLSSGNAKLAGLGAILKLDLTPVYLTTMVHGGALKAEASPNYLGTYVELGLHLNSYLDGYLRYSYSRTGAEDQVAATNSSRLRLGAKTKLPLILKPYAGLAFEREFNGKAYHAAVSDSGLAVPSLKGNTYIVECGFMHEFNKRLNVTISLEGYLGRRQGVSGGMSVGYKL